MSKKDYITGRMDGLKLALEKEIEDVLGDIYMASGMGSKAAGQFFTPYHLSKACARLIVPEPDKDGQFILNEPSCGGGGMVIATAAAADQRTHERGNDKSKGGA